mmetsp:Transcript_68996/g.180840  ORF Transcript_68996/g.180840 Transcript_68996/m.180840 type:complete len:214 (+) Transcript_68996:584-1225(+)
MMGAPRGPLLYPPFAGAFAGALAATAGTLASIFWFLVFMSSDTFLSPPVEKPLMALNTADMPPPPAPLAVGAPPGQPPDGGAADGGGGAAKPPFGGGGAFPLPPPFPGAAAAGAAAAASALSGFPAKYATGSSPLTFHMTPSLQFSLDHSFIPIRQAFRALIQAVSFSFFFCITLIAWKSIDSSTFCTCEGGEAVYTMVTTFSASATDFLFWK